MGDMEPAAEERVRRLVTDAEQLLQTMGDGARVEADPKKDDAYHESVLQAVLENNQLRAQLDERDRQLRSLRRRRRRTVPVALTGLAYAALAFLVATTAARLYTSARLAWSRWTDPGPRYGLAPDAVSAPALSAECRPFDPRALGNDSRKLYSETARSVLRHLESRPTLDFLCAQHLNLGLCYCAMRLRSVAGTIVEIGYEKSNISCVSTHEVVLSRFRSSYCLSAPALPTADGARATRRYRSVCLRYRDNVDGRLFERRLSDSDSVVAQALVDTQRGRDPCAQELPQIYQ